MVSKLLFLGLSDGGCWVNVLQASPQYLAEQWQLLLMLFGNNVLYGMLLQIVHCDRFIIIV